ncbi:NADPH:quinone reductase [bacterium]|nr:NADPH:quinone reductase [bacterium]
MKAIVVSEFGEPDVMKIADIPIPEPGADQICLKVDSAGVNPVECYVRSGIYPVLPKLPYTPGIDAAGTIAAVGSGVKGWAVGDRVYVTRSISGTYAEYTICHQSMVYTLPENITFCQGAAIGVPGSAAWRSLFYRGQAQPGERLLVHGASGSVGLFAIQLARLAGMEVFGTAGSPAGISLISKNGATRVFNHREEGYQKALMAATDGKGFNLILENLANVNLEKDLEMLSPCGRVIIVGNRGRIEIDPRLTMGKETDIRGMSLFNTTPEEFVRMHAALKGAFEFGGVTPVVSRVLPLEEAVDAHQMVLKDGNLGKIVLKP